LLDVYERALRRPHRELASVLDGVSDPWTLMAAGGGPDTLQRLDLPLDSYRAMLAILARPWLRRPFLALLRLFFRAGYFARHRRAPDAF